MKTAANPANDEASAKITQRIADLGGWRGEALANARKLILAAAPGVAEEWKWEKPTSGGVPVWSHNGILCTGESYKLYIKLTFARGASLDDPKKLFNASLEGGTRRAIDIHEGEKLNEAAFKQLIKAAVDFNIELVAQRKARKK
jgi:hypothetical protein